MRVQPDHVDRRLLRRDGPDQFARRVQIRSDIQQQHVGPELPDPRIEVANGRIRPQIGDDFERAPTPKRLEELVRDSPVRRDHQRL